MSKHLKHKFLPAPKIQPGLLNQNFQAPPTQQAQLPFLQAPPITPGLLNQNFKRFDPSTGIIDYQDDTEIILGSLNRGIEKSQGKINQLQSADTAVPTPEDFGGAPDSPIQIGVAGINEAFEGTRGQVLAQLLGQLGSAIAIPGSVQQRVGDASAQFFQNQLFSQLQQGALKGDFAGASEEFGIGSAGLTPEQQSAILRSSQTQSQIPSRIALTEARTEQALRIPPVGPQAETRGVFELLDEREDGTKETNSRIKHKWLIDPITKEKTYIGSVTSPTPTKSDRSDTPTKSSIAELERIVSQEFLNVAETNLRAGKFGGLRELIQGLTERNTGAPVASRVLVQLNPAQRDRWVEAWEALIPTAKNPAAVRVLVNRLKEQNERIRKALPTPVDAKAGLAMPLGKIYIWIDGTLVKNVKKGRKIEVVEVK